MPKMAALRTTLVSLALLGTSVLRRDLHLVSCVRWVSSPIRVHPPAADVLWERMPHLLGKQTALSALQGNSVTLLEQIPLTLVSRVKRDHIALQALPHAQSAHPVTTAVILVLHPAKHAPLVLLPSNLLQRQPVLAQTALLGISAPLQALQCAVRALPERFATNREPRRLERLALWELFLSTLVPPHLPPV